MKAYSCISEIANIRRNENVEMLFETFNKKCDDILRKTNGVIELTKLTQLSDKLKNFVFDVDTSVHDKTIMDKWLSRQSRKALLRKCQAIEGEIDITKRELLDMVIDIVIASKLFAALMVLEEILNILKEDLKFK